MSQLTTAFKLATVTALSIWMGLGFASDAFANEKPSRGVAGSDTDAASKFRQLRTELRSPNIYRSASGAPGPGYWQQRANVDIDATLDEEARRIMPKWTLNMSIIHPTR